VVEVGIVEDDVGGLAAQLEAEALAGAGGGGGGSAGKPAINRRYFTTFLLCSARVAPKKCPPCVLATKYK